MLRLKSEANLLAATFQILPGEGTTYLDDFLKRPGGRRFYFNVGDESFNSDAALHPTITKTAQNTQKQPLRSKSFTFSISVPFIPLMIVSKVTGCMTGFNNFFLFKNTWGGGGGIWHASFHYDAIALSCAAKHTLWPHISWSACVGAPKAHIDYCPFFPVQGGDSRLIIECVVGEMSNCLPAISPAFFSVSLMWQSYSFWLCANLYWIFY